MIEGVEFFRLNGHGDRMIDFEGVFEITQCEKDQGSVAICISVEDSSLMS